MTTDQPTYQPAELPEALTAVFDRDAHGMWIVELAEEPRVHSYGRTLTKAREHIRDAAALWFDIDAAEVALAEDVRLPERARSRATRALQARRRAVESQQAAAVATRDAALALVRDARLSVRDTADILGVSHQRVQQLVGQADDVPA